MLFRSLGAWAHFVIIDEKKESFIHAHPIEEANTTKLSATIHVHNESVSLGPPPTEIRTVTSFPKPGLYKLWAQFQVGEKVIVQPFVLQVGEAATPPAIAIAIPTEALRIHIGASGFAPAQLQIPFGKPVTLAITRDQEPNCGNKIVFPALGISRDLPLGATILIELPALPVGELRFTCGMGMYKGAIVIQ